MEAPWTFFVDKFSVFILCPCNARCVIWALSAFKKDDNKSRSIFLGTPAGLASGR